MDGIEWIFYQMTWFWQQSLTVEVFIKILKVNNSWLNVHHDHYIMLNNVTRDLFFCVDVVVQHHALKTLKNIIFIYDKWNTHMRGNSYDSVTIWYSNRSVSNYFGTWVYKLIDIWEIIHKFFLELKPNSEATPFPIISLWNFIRFLLKQR